MPVSYITRTVPVLLPLLLWLVTPAWGEDAALEFPLQDTLAGEEQLVTTARIPRPISKIAENVTVITSEEIALLNAHTLTDVLQTVPGIQFDTLRTPGYPAYFNIQGAIATTVLVLIDGIRANDLISHYYNTGLMPVQQIERVEIIKGAASTAWGPALGGFINVVTKEPQPDRPASGMVSGSIGSQFTADSRGELTGSAGNFGYYLSAGNLHSDGLLPYTGANYNNTFGKMTYALPGNGMATLGLSYLDGGGGIQEGAYGNRFYNIDTTSQRTFGYLKIAQPLGHRLNLELSGFLNGTDLHAKYRVRDMPTSATFLMNNEQLDRSRGATVQLTWGDRQKNLTTGVEYAHDQTKFQDILTTDPPYIDRGWDRYAVYANGAYTLGQVTILPGLRYDRTGQAGEKLSWNLGATWQVATNTVLRAYGAQGYSLPYADPYYGQTLQDVWTVQGGVETGVVPFLWLKGTYFYNSLKNSESVGVISSVTDQRRQGFELDARTIPLYGFSLATGYTYLDAKDAVTGTRMQTNGQQTVPPHILKLAFRYDHPGLGCHARVIGNYVSWNAAPGETARDGGIIWDLHLNWTVFPEDDLSPELFFSGHNLFSGVQATDTIMSTNAPRWFDGGVRFRF